MEIEGISGFGIFQHYHPVFHNGGAVVRPMNIAKISLVWIGKLKTAPLPHAPHTQHELSQINFITWAHDALKLGTRIIIKEKGQMVLQLFKVV